MGISWLTSTNLTLIAFLLIYENHSPFVLGTGTSDPDPGMISIKKCCNFGDTFIQNASDNSYLCEPTLPKIALDSEEMLNISPEFSVTLTGWNFTLLLKGITCGNSSFYYRNRSTAKESGADDGFVQFTSEGHLRVGKNEFYSPENFCMDKLNESAMVIQLCKTECNVSSFRVPFMYKILAGFNEFSGKEVYMERHHKVTEDSSSDFVFAIVFSVVVFSSSLFLLAAATVNFLLWRKQNLHTWTVQAHIVCLFLVYIFLGLVHLVSALGYRGGYCVIIGGALHYFLLSTFCWLSMINFDLWWKFRKLRARNGIPYGRKLTLCMYACFSFIIPGLIILVGILISSFSPEMPGLVRMVYGKTICALEESSLWPYAGGPIAVILVTNLMFFLSTVYCLHVIKKDTRMAAENIKTSKQWKEVKIFVKLFCITGVLWNFGGISYIIDPGNGLKHKLWYWCVVDSMYVFQAVAIFFIFTWKRRTRTALETEYPAIKRMLSKLQQYSCASSCSQDNAAQVDFNQTIGTKRSLSVISTNTNISIV